MPRATIGRLISPLKGLSENSTSTCLASRSYLNYVQIERKNDGNLLEVPDSFSILTRGF